MSASSLASPWIASGGIFRDPRLSDAGLLAGLAARTCGDMKSASAMASALGEAGLSRRPLFLVKQVHGTTVVRVGEDSPVEPPLEADGLVTDRRDAVLGVFVADCMPLFLWDKGARAAGLFHVGWRGAQGGMPRAAAAAMRSHFGCAPGELLASVGPHIRPCCYRVGPETAERFRPESVSRRKEGLTLDLGAEAKAQLVEAGVPADAVAVSADCTSCRRDDFYSFRRDRGSSRMMAFLALGG